MIEELKSTLRELAGSKKFVVGAASLIAFALTHLAGRLGVAITPDGATFVADRILAIGMVYIGGQAVADHGKDAAAATLAVAKVQADSVTSAAQATADATKTPQAVNVTIKDSAK